MSGVFTMTDFTIYQAAEADALEIANVHIESRIAAYSSFLPDKYLYGDTLQSRCQNYKNFLIDNRTNTYVSKISDNVNGFICLGPAHSEGFDPNVTMEIYTMYIL